MYCRRIFLLTESKSNDVAYDDLLGLLEMRPDPDCLEVRELLEEGVDTAIVAFGPPEANRFEYRQKRIDALKRLLDRKRKWNVFPFSTTGKAVLSRLTKFRKHELLDALPERTVDSTPPPLEERKWRFGNKYLKFPDGRIKMRRFIDLPLSLMVRRLQSLTKTTAEKSLKELGTPNSLQEREAPAVPVGDEAAIFDGRDLHELLVLLDLSPRERELLELLGDRDSRSEAAIKMGISRSTANNLYARAVKKNPRLSKSTPVSKNEREPVGDRRYKCGWCGRDRSFEKGESPRLTACKCGVAGGFEEMR
jgi:hypothetical protein